MVDPGPTSQSPVEPLSSEVPSFALWCDVQYAESTYSTLQTAGFKFSTTGSARPSWLPNKAAFTSLENAVQETRSGKLHIVLPCGHHGDASYRVHTFKIAFRDLARREFPEDMIKHPSALLDFLNLDLSGHLFSTGYPSSGNGVFSSIADHVLEHCVRKPGHSLFNRFFNRTKKTDATTKSYALDFDTMTASWLADLMGADGFHEFGMAVSTLSTGRMFSYATTSNLDDSSHSLVSRVIEGVPFRYLNYNQTSMTHAQLSRPELERLKASGARRVCIIREPIEHLLSLWRKELNAHAIYNLDQPGASEQFAIMCKHAVRIKSVFEYLSANRDLFSVWSYTHLAQDPVSTISSIASDIGASVSPGEANKIWITYGNRQLPTASEGHFQKGTNNVSDGAVPPIVVGVLKHLGVDEIAGEYGWGDTAKAITRGSLTPEQEKELAVIVERDQDGRAVPDGFHGGAQLSERFGDTFNKSMALGERNRDSVVVGSNTGSHVIELEAIMSSSHWSGLILSGRFESSS